MQLLKYLLSIAFFVSLFGLASHILAPPTNLKYSIITSIPVSYKEYAISPNAYNLTEAEQASLVSDSPKASNHTIQSRNRTTQTARHNL